MSRSRQGKMTGRSPEPVPGNRVKKTTWLHYAALSASLAVVTLIAYGPSFSHPFLNFDDFPYVAKNPHVQTGLKLESIGWAFTTFACGNWHPLTWMSLELDASLFGGQNAGAFHRTNVLLHAANAILLFLVLAQMTETFWRSALVAFLFALHPLHVESVAWVAERKDVLSTLFFILTLAAYLAYVRRPGVGRYLVVVLTMALGLLAKPMLVTLPFVLLLLDYWPLCRWPHKAVTLRRLLFEKAPLLALAMASSVITYNAQRVGHAVGSIESYSLSVRVLNALSAFGAYLVKLAWPMNLAAYYHHPGAAVAVGPALSAGACLAAITILVIWQGRARPYLAVGWLWYLGTLVPVIGLVQVGSQAMADRYTYIPLLGPFIMLSWGAADLASALPRSRLVLTIGLALASIAIGVLTFRQVKFWSSEVVLWQRVADVSKDNLWAHSNLGLAYSDVHKFDIARREFEEALRIDSRNAGVHNNYGLMLAASGAVDEAQREYRLAVELDPSLAGPHLGLGSLLRGLNRFEEAEAEYRQSIALDDSVGPAHTELCGVLLELGRLDEALAEARLAVAVEPDSGTTHGMLALCFDRLGQFEEALPEYQIAVRLELPKARESMAALEQKIELRRSLPAVIAGTEGSFRPGEKLVLAELCRSPTEGRYTLAARLYAQAFAADSRLVANTRTGSRYRAACAAAMAGSGQGQDAKEIDATAQAKLRGQALAWLQADLAFWTKNAESPLANERKVTNRILRQWRRTPELASVRGESIEALPAAERSEWRKLWQDVDALLAKGAA
jgi:protein O-mannosyl-transferase